MTKLINKMNNRFS